MGKRNKIGKNSVRKTHNKTSSTKVFGNLQNANNNLSIEQPEIRNNIIMC